MAEFSPSLIASSATLMPLFVTAMNDTTPQETRVGAVRAVMSIIINTEKEEEAMVLQGLAPAIIAGVCLPLQSKVRRKRREEREQSVLSYFLPHFSHKDGDDG